MQYYVKKTYHVPESFKLEANFKSHRKKTSVCTVICDSQLPLLTVDSYVCQL